MYREKRWFIYEKRINITKKIARKKTTQKKVQKKRKKVTHRKKTCKDIEKIQREYKHRMKIIVSGDYKKR